MKTKAVREMEQPKSVSEIWRFMGMANQLGKFSPNLAEYSQPLRELLSSKSAWVWGPPQDEAFQRIKDELAKPTTLALYNVDAKTKIRADASAYGLGAVLLQCQKQQWKPVAYAPKSLTETERRYSQIEKEALALVWSCEKFSTYVIGKHIEIETDHKPLVPLLSTTVWIVYHLEFCVFDYVSLDLTILSVTFPVKACIQLIHSRELQCRQQNKCLRKTVMLKVSYRLS